MTADELMNQFIAQAKDTPWVTELHMSVESDIQKMRLTMIYIPSRAVFIDGPQEQFLAYAMEEVDLNRRDVHFLGRSSNSIATKLAARGERRYEWFPGQAVNKGESDTIRLELPSRLLEMLK